MTWSMLCQILCILLMISTCAGRRPRMFGHGRRNHKSKAKQHKRVKFPYVQKWCLATNIKQVIQVKGCETKTIKNKACVGQCSSFHFPGMHPPDGDVMNKMQQCNCCKPSLSSWMKLRLNCSHAPNVDKLVEIVYECQCSRCKSVTGMK